MRKYETKKICKHIFLIRTPPVAASSLSKCVETFTETLDFSCCESFLFGKNYQKGNLLKCRYIILLKNNIPSRR